MNRMHVVLVAILAAALALVHRAIASRLAANHNQTRLVV